jgi:hypothetical protein
MVRGVRTRSWLASTAVAALSVAVLAQPAFGRLPHYRLHVFRGPAHSHSVFNKIADDGTAVGQRLHANGTSRGLILTNRRRPGGSPLGGRQSALVGINAADQMAGALILSRTTTNPLYLNGSTARALSVPGSANGITIGPLVAVTATAANGQQHVLVWQPTTGAFRDLGVGIARGIGVGGIVVGQALTGQAAYWTADGAIHVLGFNGMLLQVNLFGRAIGFSTQSGGPRPITLDLRQPSQVTNMKLPRGFRFGTAKGISNSGLIVGDAFKRSTGGLPSQGLVWFSPTRAPVAVQRLVRGLPRGLAITDASGVNDNGLIVGSSTGARGPRSSADAPQEEDAIEVEPDVTSKVGQLEFLIPILKLSGSPTAKLAAQFDVVSHHLAFGASSRIVCRDLRELGNVFGTYTTDKLRPGSQAELRLSGRGSVLEIEIERGCLGPLTPLLASG